MRSGRRPNKFIQTGAAFPLPGSPAILPLPPGKVKGTKIGPSGPAATPSPFAPRRSISISSSKASPDQEFHIAAAAENRGSDLADDRPARFFDEVAYLFHSLF